MAGKRVVAGTIDADGVYFSRAAAGGGFVFLTGNPVDESGKLADAAKPPAPYEGSSTAQVRLQTKYVFDQLDAVLPKIGSSVLNICQLEQYVKDKIQSEGYFEIALGPDFMGPARPGGATAQVGEYFPEGSGMTVTGIAVIPDEASGFEKSFPGEDPTVPRNPNAKFSDIVGAGPYAFTTYYPSDGKTGVHPSVKVEDWIWRGNEAQQEAKFLVEQLTAKLGKVGSSLDQIIDYTLFLQDPGDLYEFDLVLREALGDNAPSRTVIPIRGTALPRKEGAFGHSEGSPRSEAQIRFLIPGKGAEKVVVAGPGADFGYQSAGVRGGPLLWMSSQYADAKQLGGGTDKQIANILDKLGDRREERRHRPVEPLAAACTDHQPC